MDVCPKCGHHDPPIWLNHKFQQHITYCRVEDFKKFYPELAKQLQYPGDITSDDFYYYRLTTTSPFVYRWLKEYGEKGYHLNYEKPSKEDYYQTHLVKRGVSRAQSLNGFLDGEDAPRYCSKIPLIQVNGETFFLLFTGKEA